MPQLIEKVICILNIYLLMNTDLLPSVGQLHYDFFLSTHIPILLVREGEESAQDQFSCPLCETKVEIRKAEDQKKVNLRLFVN